MLCFAGLGISFFPLMVPPDITIWQAAAPRASQMFVLVGAAVLIPLILAYSGFSYWVFRGKVQEGAHYTDQTSLWRQLVWFAGLWVAGVLSLGGVATLLRWALRI